MGAVTACDSSPPLGTEGTVPVVGIPLVLSVSSRA